MCRIRLPDMMVLVAGIYMITPGKLLIYKKVYGEWQGCMPCTHQHLREHFALPGRPVPIDNSTGRLGVTGGLRRCQVIPTGWLWFSGTKTNSAAVIQYRFPDNLSAAKVFFRIRPHILPIAIHYRLINAPFALVLPQYYLGTNHCINSFIYAKYSISHIYSIFIYII